MWSNPMKQNHCQRDNHATTQQEKKMLKTEKSITQAYVIQVSTSKAIFHIIDRFKVALISWYCIKHCTTFFNLLLSEFKLDNGLSVLRDFWKSCPTHIQWNSVIMYPQGKWKQVRSNQNTFYPKRDFPHWQDRFHVFTRTICHGRCVSILNVVHYSLSVRWNRLSGHCELENVRENWNRNWKAVDDMLVIRKKKQRKGKKVLLDGKLVCNIRCCAMFCTSYPKNVHVFRLAMPMIDGENVITESTY